MIPGETFAVVLLWNLGSVGARAEGPIGVAEGGMGCLVQTFTSPSNWWKEIHLGEWEGLVIGGYLDPPIRGSAKRDSLASCQIYVLNGFKSDILLQTKRASAIEKTVNYLPDGGQFGRPRSYGGFDEFHYTRLKARQGPVVSLLKERAAGYPGGSITMWLVPLNDILKQVRKEREEGKTVNRIRLTFEMMINWVVVGSGMEYSPKVCLVFEDEVADAIRGE